MDLIGPVNPVMRDPHDFGSREFWKAANAHAVRRWAEATDEVMRLKALVEWADTIICSSQPDESSQGGMSDSDKELARSSQYTKSRALKRRLRKLRSHIFSPATTAQVELKNVPIACPKAKERHLGAAMPRKRDTGQPRAPCGLAGCWAWRHSSRRIAPALSLPIAVNGALRPIILRKVRGGHDRAPVGR